MCSEVCGFICSQLESLAGHCSVVLEWLFYVTGCTQHYGGWLGPI